MNLKKQQQEKLSGGRNMLQTIRTILSKYTTVRTDEIKENSVLTADLGLSSFDVVSIVSDFEDEFDIEVPDRDIRKLITVGDIIDYIQKKI